MELKNFIDFAYSMKNMDEVKSGKFLLPKEIVFELDKNQHMKIEREVLHQKGINDKDVTHFNDFDVEIFDINFRFKINEE